MYIKLSDLENMPWLKFDETLYLRNIIATTVVGLNFYSNFFKEIMLGTESLTVSRPDFKLESNSYYT